jgi:hypothetical protein
VPAVVAFGPAGGRKPLWCPLDTGDGVDHRAVGLHREQAARFDGVAVEFDRAGATFPRLTAHVRRGVALFAQRVDQQASGLDRDGFPVTVNGHRNLVFGHSLSERSVRLTLGVGAAGAACRWRAEAVYPPGPNGQQMSPAEFLPLAAGVHGRSLATLALLTLGAALTAVVAGLAVAAFVRRRSTPYLLVALALSSLVARTVVGFAGYADLVGPTLHHELEHALDVVMAALVIAAVYLVGTGNRNSSPPDAARADGGQREEGQSDDGYPDEREVTR